MRQKPLKIADIERTYQRTPSLSRYLPWMSYSPQAHCFLLQDGLSVGACFEITPVPCEARSGDFMQELSDKITRCLQSIPPCKAHPWVMQCYVGYEAAPGIKPPSILHPLTKIHQRMLKQHHQDLQGGLFRDHTVTGQRFRLQHQRIRCVLYQPRYPQEGQSQAQTRRDAISALTQARIRFCEQLHAIGINYHLMEGADFYAWMLRWFNPHPAITQGDSEALLTLAPYPSIEEQPLDWCLADRLFFSTPHSTAQGWAFDGWAHRILPVQGWQRAPSIGLLSAPQTRGDQSYALLDCLPPGSIFNITWVIAHPDQTHQHLARVYQSAVGGHAQALQIKSHIDQATDQMARGNGLYTYVMQCFLRAKDAATLLEHEQHAQALFASHGFALMDSAHLLAPADSYIRALPMNYQPSFDQKYQYRARYAFSQHIAHTLPFYGRSRGTGTPGVCFYNRGGEPLTWDPLVDKTKNAHVLMLGETGTGKSNLLVYLLSEMLARHNPRLFILEAGGSFDLFADFLEAQGLSVHHVKLDPQHPISLNPFAHALAVLEKGRESQSARMMEGELNQDSLIERDIIGEMAISAQVMITGGEPEEIAKMSRRDRMVIIEAILMAASTVKAANRTQMIAEDIVIALETLAGSWDIKQARDKIQRTQEMADGLRYFCTDPLSQQFFNTTGDPWPLVDVTVVDFGLFAQSGYEAQRAVAFAGCHHHILAQAEANQNTDRPMIAAFDENHLFTPIPLLAELQTRLAKMGRKLGLALWILTQNMTDFPDEAHKMLAMMESFICLALPPDEIAQVERFKPLSTQERQLLLSAKKAKGQYTEGVILSPALTALFRHVPPKEYLALAGTEQNEKYARAQIMKAHSVSEWEAALIMAKKMRQDISCD